MAQTSPTRQPIETPTPTPIPTPAPPTAVINGHVFRLEVADTAAERRRGLMERESLPEDAAMLFVFDDEGYHSFWMKGTLIPLDALFLDSQGHIVDIQTMSPQPGVPDSELERYVPEQPALYALEMNAGAAEHHGVKVGDEVRLVLD